MDGFPSGQRGQTVNLLAPPSKVRILLHPLWNELVNRLETTKAVRILLHPLCRSGGTGRRTGLKILRDLYSRTGSIPVCGSKFEQRMLRNQHSLFFWLFTFFTRIFRSNCLVFFLVLFVFFHRNNGKNNNEL